MTIMNADCSEEFLEHFIDDTQIKTITILALFSREKREGEERLLQSGMLLLSIQDERDAILTKSLN